MKLTFNEHKSNSKHAVTAFLIALSILGTAANMLRRNAQAYIPREYENIESVEVVGAKNNGDSVTFWLRGVASDEEAQVQLFPNYQSIVTDETGRTLYGRWEPNKDDCTLDVLAQHLAYSIPVSEDICDGW